MINKYFIGTSLDIRLNFWKKGNAEGSTKVEDIPCNISGYRRSVFYKTSKGIINVDDSVCSGSTLTWQFKGTEQRITGIYTIVVILYNGDGSELIHHEFEGFGLIMPKYCYEPPKDRNIIRDAWIELYEFHPVIPEVSTITENWVVDGVDTGKSSRGSAMFAGTEISNENLVITSSISSIVSKYGKVFKKDDLYFNTSSSDIFKCVSVSTIGLSCTTNWKLIGNSQGVGIASFELKVKSEEDGGANIYLLTLTDGKKFQIVINNGSRGSQGKSLTYDDLSDDEKEDLANRNLPEVKVMVAEEVEKLGDLKDILTVVPRIKALEDNDAEIQSKVSTLESGKANKTDIPDVSEFITKNVGDLLNYYTKSNTYTKLEVNTLLDSVKQFTYESVSVLPAASEETMNRIFLVPSGEGKNDNVKEEFITIQENGAYKWEQIGSTTIDLSGYVSLEALEEKLAAYALSTDVIEAIKDFVTNASLTTILNSYTTSEWVKANAVLHTDNTVSVLGTDKTVSKLSTPIVYVSSGLIMGGTAASAGLVTRGICGVVPPSENGGCTKENLYINYDSTNKYSSNRQLVIQAGAVGTHYGNNLYQYCAARGDAVKGYSDSHYAALSHTHSLSDVSIIEATEEEIDALFQ